MVKKTDTTTVEKKKAEVPEEPAPQLPAATGAAVPAALDDYAEYAGVGLENIGRDEMLIPFFRILQSNSPQCDPENGAYIQGAVQGMIINTATNQLYNGKTGFTLIPCYRDHNFVEFVPRTAGGGFVGLHAPDEDIIARLRREQGEFGKLKLDPTNEQSNEITETFYLYGLVLIDGEDPVRGVIGFASTQIKAYKSMMTHANGILLRLPNRAPIPFPLFAHRWLFKTVSQQNKKGKFYGWSIGLVGGAPLAARLSPKDPLFQAGADFNKLIASGAVKADYERGDVGDEGEGGGGSSGGGGAPDDEEMPF